jgi:hypothetical protein
MPILISVFVFTLLYGRVRGCNPDIFQNKFHASEVKNPNPCVFLVIESRFQKVFVYRNDLIEISSQSTISCISGGFARVSL